jgi:hypothetical protein
MTKCRRSRWNLLVLPCSLGLAALACRGSDGPAATQPPAGSGGSVAAGGTTGSGGGGGGPPGADSGAGGAPAAFEPLPPHVYAAKVKNLLTGLALTDAELQAVTKDPNGGLKALIDTWMALPQWKTKMLGFFTQAFEQTQTDVNDYDEQIGFTTNPWNNIDKQRFVRAAEESFARTALALVEEGAPFTQVVTTERFMLNPPLMSLYAFMDAVPLDDDAKPVKAQLWMLRKYPALTFERTTNPDPADPLMAPRPIAFADSINPGTPAAPNPNFMRFYEPKPYVGTNVKCKEPEIITNPGQALRYVANYLFGGRPGCGSTDSQWTESDWDAWRWVTVRKPQGTEERTTFWDVPTLRKPDTQALVLATPRVGFMTTMAFFANWPTNLSNSYRVTTNQALIVGLGRSFDDSGTTLQVNENSSDSMHVQPNTACYGCHHTLDPMRDFFRETYSLSYFTQYAAEATLPPTGTFAVEGGPAVTGNGVRAFAQAMAQHPAFAAAWTQKLCAFANSSPCDDSDPEFLRIAQAFADSKFSWKTLVRELMSSPLVTFAASTKTAVTNGVIISIARREALCASLEERLGLVDLCSLRGPLPAGAAMGGINQIRSRARNLALAIPGGGYARGDTTPLLPHDSNLFFSGSTENLCQVLAERLVDQPAGQMKFISIDREPAIANMISMLMGLPPGDPRSADMSKILHDHFAEALAAGANVKEATQSMFMLACSSPLGVAIGL